MRRTVWVLAPAILVAVMACGHSGPAASHGSPAASHEIPAASHETGTTFHLADSGRNVTVNVGDRLSLNLGSSSDRHWVLVINTFACPPATVHGCSKPESGKTPSGSPAASRVPGEFTLTVQVM